MKLLLTLSALLSLMTLNAQVQPPVARKVPKALAIHGDTRTDNYYWLRDKTDPEAVEYLKAENAYTESVMKPNEALRDTIYNEILSRTKQTDLEVPVKDGPYFYYSRTVEGKQYPIFCRKKDALSAPEEVTLDANELAAGQAYFSLGGYNVSEDHKLLAYMVDNNGSEHFTLHIKDLSTGKTLPDQIGEITYGTAWGNDNRTLFYTTFDATQRPDRIRRHVLGSDPAQDAIVYTDNDGLFDVSLSKSRDRRFLLITTANTGKTSEVSFLDASKPSGSFQVVAPRRAGIEYYVEPQDDQFLIRTNDDGAVNFKLMSVNVADPARKNWKEVIPVQPDTTLTGVDAFAGFTVLHTRENGLPNIRVRNRKSGATYSVTFPEPAYSVAPAANPEYQSTLLRFTYTSLVTPRSVYDFNMADRTRALLKQTEILGGYDPSRYRSERIYATASDGKRIPISLVYKTGFVRDGKAPAFLMGYGSYGINSDPAFSTSALSLLDRGFVYAIAHVRGGSEFGRQWFDDGRMLHKRNSFTDFIACGEYLVSQKYTSPAKLAAMGGSAGGLLMGAVINLRPGLFHTVIAAVPFVDVVTTMLDPTIPLTTGEYDQWGNPEDKKYYDYIKSYSPYDNVEHKAYPNLLVTTGLNDPRVAYWEPAKWVARLRAYKTDHNVLLLKTQMGAGHGGPSGRYERMKETAFFYAFILSTMGPI